MADDNTDDFIETEENDITVQQLVERDDGSMSFIVSLSRDALIQMATVGLTQTIFDRAQKVLDGADTD